MKYIFELCIVKATCIWSSHYGEYQDSISPKPILKIKINDSFFIFSEFYIENCSIEILEWINKNIRGSYIVTAKENNGIILHYKFHDVNDALKFKLTFSDYIVTLSEKYD